MFWLYQLLLSVSIPLFPLLKKTVSKRGKVSLKNRFSTEFSEGKQKFLLHVSSIGEVNSVKPLVKALQGKVSLTVFTDYGLERARKIYPEIPSRISPIDLYPIVKNFLKKTSPKAVLIYETEIWPSLLKASSELQVPTIFVSGKIGERTYRRIKRFEGFLKPLFSDKIFLSRSEEDAERALKLGFKEVQVVGDLKLDYEPPEKGVSLEIDEERPVVIWGSTHEGEEELAVEVHKKLKRDFPNILTVIAPRHVGRRIDISGNVEYRSRTKRVRRETEFYIVDTVGELSSLYSYATVAVVGGSFVEGIGGHNPVEPVALKVPTLIGEFGNEFKEIAQTLKVPVLKRSELYPCLLTLLKEPKLRSKLGKESYFLWQERRGVTERILRFLGERVELQRN
ncbi:3-deoxy-D-manno-octulosonic-acid transferase [Balnearium lithotrophicum]|uniref:3-deoxy-D-manno-octulosonic acid transferase n=1 Tax=Balnearium lithotrophicum TaxID=223788 RepID=A0A521BWQ9_9BACT|nr:glycosyltransferase N-terminal domain-containing protein [Balnearium lithotrophicum]SMO51623.1 3-deoxy-D-manno-octulosonic-acid transferase [Balnearium lithotrophicum]